MLGGVFTQSKTSIRTQLQVSCVQSVMQERWARPWQRVACEMKHSKATIQRDRQESERTLSNSCIFCAWHQIFWKVGEICFFLPSYKLFCEYLQGVGSRWVALERCAEMVRADIADQRWESVCREHRRDDSPKGQGEQRCTHWCNGEGRGQTVWENNPCSSRLKRWPGSLLAALDLDKVWDFQWGSPSDTAVSVMRKETLRDVVNFLNEPSCMCFHPREHKKAI